MEKSEEVFRRTREERIPLQDGENNICHVTRGKHYGGKMDMIGGRREGGRKEEGRKEGGRKEGRI